MAKKKKGEADEAAADEKDTDKKAAGGEGDAPEGAEGEAKPGMSKKKKIIIAAVALLLILGGGGGAGYYFMVVKKASHAADGEAIGADGKPVNVPVFYTLPEFLVNLNTSTKQSSFLKTTIILELNNQTDVVVVEMNLPRLTDAMNTYLRELRSSDLAGSAGIQRLREELLVRANKSLAPLQVNNILFKDIVVQ